VTIHIETFNQIAASPNIIPDWTNWGTFDSLGTTISAQNSPVNDFTSMFYTPLDSGFQSSVITIGAFSAPEFHGASVFMSGNPSTGSGYTLLTDTANTNSAFRLFKSDKAGVIFTSLFVSPTEGTPWQATDTIGLTGRFVGRDVILSLFKNGIQYATFTDVGSNVMSGSPGFYNFNPGTLNNDTVDDFVGVVFVEEGSRNSKDRRAQINLSPNYKTRGAQGRQVGGGSKHRSPLTKIR